MNNSRKVIEAVSNLPHGANGEAAAAAVRDLGPEYNGVKAVDSGIVSVLTAHERPGEQDSSSSSSSPSLSPLDQEERAHEDLLFGLEVCTAKHSWAFSIVWFRKGRGVRGPGDRGRGGRGGCQRRRGAFCFDDSRRELGGFWTGREVDCSIETSNLFRGRGCVEFTV